MKKFEQVRVNVEEKVVVIHRGRCNNKVYYRLSHDVVTLDVDCFRFLTRVANTKHIFQWFEGFSKGEN